MNEQSNTTSPMPARTPLRRRGIYILPNLFTSAALFAGFYAAVQAINHNFEAATIAIFIAMVLDGLDGRVARLTNTQSAFGAEYDSLSDMVSFGVAPALVIYTWALGDLGKLGWIAAFIYCVCAALRLARFNTNINVIDKGFFQGLPSPAAAALVSGFIWVMTDLGIDGRSNYMPYVACAVAMFAGISMVTNVFFYSGKSINFRRTVPFAMALVVVVVLLCIYSYPPGVLFGLFVCYALSGYVRATVRLIRKRRANKLAKAKTEDKN